MAPPAAASSSRDSEAPIVVRVIARSIARNPRNIGTDDVNASKSKSVIRRTKRLIVRHDWTWILAAQGKPCQAAAPGSVGVVGLGGVLSSALGAGGGGSSDASLSLARSSMRRCCALLGVGAFSVTDETGADFDDRRNGGGATFTDSTLAQQAADWLPVAH